MNQPGENKPPMGLLPPLAALAIAATLDHGARGKHKPFGWVNEDIQLFRDAGQRHHYYREAGEVYDRESGLLHSAHKATNAVIELAKELQVVDLWTPDEPAVDLRVVR